jgi:hypothetical protein
MSIFGGSFFDCVVTNDRQILFTETNEFRDIISRSNIVNKYNILYRHHVCLGCYPSFDVVFVDDETTLPLWYVNHRDEIETRVKELALKLFPAYKVYLEEVEPARIKKEILTMNFFDDPASLGEYTTIVSLGEQNDAWHIYRTVEREARTKYARAIKNIKGYVGK